MSTTRLRDHPATRPTLRILAVVAGLHVVLVATLLILRALTGDAVLAGTFVDGVEVSGLSEAALRQTVAAHADDRLDEPVEVVAEDDRLTATRAEAGLRAEVDTMAEAAWARGRRGLYTATYEQLAARFGASVDLPFVTDVDPQALVDWSAQAADELSVTPQPASVTLALTSDGQPDPAGTPASGGSRVEADEIAAAVRRVLERPGPASVTVRVEPLPPPTNQADLDAALAAARLALSAPVTLINPSASDDVVLDPAALTEVLEVGYEPDADAGTRLPLTSDADRLGDHLGTEATAALAAGPVDATIDLSGEQPTVQGGTPGIEPDLAAAARLVASLSQRETDRRAELPGELEPPDLPADDAEEALAASGLRLDPVTLRNPSDGDDAVHEADDLRAVLDVAVVRDDGEVAVTIEVEPQRYLDVLDERVDAIEAEPVEAEVALVGGEVQRSGGTSGLVLDAEQTAASLEALVTEQVGQREGELAGEVLEPEFTRAMADSIREEVSTFTTSLTPGQSRNTNIRRALELINGQVILPGERYSLNEGIGERTPERGFVENGFIFEGEVVSATGGGVSQVGTTFLNAAWFAGIKLMAFQPHSLYFSRYPMGREATLSYGQIDVVVENDSPHAILIVSGASDSEATVAFWSTTWASVESFTSEPYNIVTGRYRNGFTVDFGRTITYLDGTSREDTYTHTYRPENSRS